MKLVNIHGPGDVRVDDAPEPECGPRDAVVRVQCCGICGSDLTYVKNGGLPIAAVTPMPLGHELSAVVEEVGSEVSGLREGQRVVLNPTLEKIGNGGREGGFAPRLKVANAADGGRLFPIPDSLPDHLAALVEPLGVGMHAVDQGEAKRGDKVVVCGVGPIGLAAIATLRDRGIDDVVAMDLSARRLEIAKDLGARATLNAGADDAWEQLAELHGRTSVEGLPAVGSDLFIEASGAPPVIPQILLKAKRHARMSVVAVYAQPTEIHFVFVLMKEMTIRGAMEYPADFNQMIDLLGRWDLSPMITHRFPLERFPEAFETAKDPQAAGKVVIDIA